MSEKSNKDIGIGRNLWKVYSQPGYQHPWGRLGHYIGIFILLSFIVVIGPLFIVTWFLSPLYFWFYKQTPIPPGPFFKFDRHKVKYLSFADKLGCEYCELANGTLQWVLAITNEIERRWCPIKNECDPNCSKIKEWRKDYVNFHHTSKELSDYYEHQFAKEFPETEKS